jgi:2-methylcitrate dehydratase PrpD
MNAEERLVDFICDTRLEDLPPRAVDVIKNQFLAVAGTTVAGAFEEGCEQTVRMLRDLGGKREATILVHGDRIPAHDAAFVNGMMARALDFCDAMAPGAHIGAATVSASLAASELAGGVGGRSFLAALAIGAEVAARLNLSEEAYDGFDPTGICVIFGVAAASSRILGLSKQETWNALALSFNRCGGSFQSNIDGCLGVRVIEGWVAQGGLLCARLAKAGVTGPKNFLGGIYGYLHLYGRDRVRPEDLVQGLGEEYALERIVFKKYPSCGMTQGPTDMTLRLVSEEGVSAENVDRILITVTPYAYKLVGHDFKIGDNPRVDSQFSIQYCVANALIRGASRLEHFEEGMVQAGEVQGLVERIEVRPDQAMEARGHTPVDMLVRTKDGREIGRQIDIAPGFPGNALKAEDHERRFRDCVAYAKRPMDEGRSLELVSAIRNLEKIDDVGKFVHLLSA